MDSQRVEAVYEEIGKYSVDLSSDAWSLGPKHVHELISMTRGYLNAVTHILQEILQERQNLDRAKHAAEAAYRIDSDRLLAEDDRVRRLPNIDDRKATIGLILRERLSEIQTLEGQLLDLSYVERAVRHRYNELKATMTDIRAQRALIRDAIDSGSFYGDETDASRGHRGNKAPAVQEPDFSEDEIAQTMAELNDILVSGDPPTAPDPVVAPPPEAPKPAPAPDDFSDLIDGVVEETPAVVAPKPVPEDPDLARFLDDDELSNLFSDDTDSV